jgi:hypothetical protein
VSSRSRPRKALISNISIMCTISGLWERYMVSRPVRGLEVEVMVGGRRAHILRGGSGPSKTVHRRDR